MVEYAMVLVLVAVVVLLALASFGTSTRNAIDNVTGDMP